MAKDARCLGDDGADSLPRAMAEKDCHGKTDVQGCLAWSRLQWEPIHELYLREASGFSLSPFTKKGRHCAHKVVHMNGGNSFYVNLHPGIAPKRLSRIGLSAVSV